jgi:uncharacterized protein (TIGR03435 family)
MRVSYLVTPVLIAVYGIPIVFSQVTPTFEVASIRPVPVQVSNVSIGLLVDGSQARFTYLSLKDYISRAYRLKAFQIVGPDWLASEKFDIAAKLPLGATTSQIPEMLQTLLRERFHLELHPESKDFPVYSLEVGRSGFKLHELPADRQAITAPTGTLNVAVTVTSAGVNYDFGNGSTLNFIQRGLEGKKITMMMLTDTLSWYLDLPLIDRTGLNGNYDMNLAISAEDYRAMSIRSAVVAGVVLPPALAGVLDQPWGDSLRNALGQAGLVLERRKAPLEIIVIDSIDRKPTEN